MAPPARLGAKETHVAGATPRGSGDGDGVAEEQTPCLKDGARLNSPEGPPEDFRPIIIDKIDPNLFLARPENLWKPPGGRAVFGGQVLGQSLSAASKTVQPGLSLHSLHAYFVRAGQPEIPIVYEVHRVRNGASFATRLVSAKQDGRWIFTMSASFHRPEAASLHHMVKMPLVPAPETVPTDEERCRELIARPETPPAIKAYAERRLHYVKRNPLDVRWIVSMANWSTEAVRKDPFLKGMSDLGMPAQMGWFRTKRRLPDEEHVHHAVLAYQSDAGLLATCHADKPDFWDLQPMMASLDHSMWFHQPFPHWRADQWLLYVTYSPCLSGARGLAHGHIFTQDGRLVVSCTQEGLIRLGSDRALPAPPPASISVSSKL